MADFKPLDYYQQLIRDIIELMSDADDPPLDHMGDLAKRYRDAVKECNSRLQHCDRLLHKGLRAEAIQRCALEPNLLDLVTTLDFAGRDTWNQYAEFNSLPTAPQLLIEIAAELNEAYSHEGALANLMRRHRLMALSRRPLTERIALMRKIARLDKNNLVWQEDIRTFERRRCLDIAKELTSAAKEEKLALVDALSHELRGGEWLESPAPALVDRASEIQADLRAKKAREELCKLVPMLVEAFSSLDAGQGRRLRERWNQLAEICGLSPDDPLAEQVLPALDWLQAEDQKDTTQTQFRTALAALEAALDADVSRTELERLYYALTRHEQDIPDLLRSRVAERLQYLQFQEDRRVRKVAVTAIATVVLVVAATGWGAARFLRRSAIDEHAASLQSLIEAGNLDGAKQYLTELEESDKSAADHPELQRLGHELEELRRKENERRAHFDAALKMAIDQGVTNATWESFAAADKALDTANELARTDGERVEVQQVKNDRIATERAMRRRVNEPFAMQLKDLEERCKPLPKDRDELFDLLEKTRQLERKPYVDKDLTDRAGTLRLLLENEHKKAVTIWQQEQQLKYLDRDVGHPQQFAERLKAFASQYPGELGRAFEQLLKNNELRSWMAVEEWNKFVLKFEGLDLARLSPARAAEQVVELVALRDQDAQSPVASWCQPIIDFLTPIAQREEGGKPIVSDLRAQLAHRVYDPMFEVRMRDGKVFYCQEKPTLGTGRLTLRYIPSRDAVDDPKGARSRPIFEKDLDPAGPRVAGHSFFAATARSELQGVTTGNWEEVVANLVGLLYESSPPKGVAPMDPIERLRLLLLFLDVASRGSGTLQRHYKEDFDTLSASRNDVDMHVNWFNPDDDQVAKQRQKAIQILGQLKVKPMSAAELKEATARAFAQVRPARISWIGYATRGDSPGDWQVRGLPKEMVGRGDAAIYVLTPRPDGASVEWIQAGRIQGGKVVLDPAVAPRLLSGRPLFARFPWVPNTN